MLDPLNILKNEWENIREGIRTAHHDFHSFVLSTIRNNGPESRTMILRFFNEDDPSIWFHTDKRSEKLLDIKDNKDICTLFYDRSRRIQLRMHGIGSIEEDGRTTKAVWGSMRPESKLCYMGPYAPSEVIAEYKPNIINKSAQEIDESDDLLGYSRFCRVKITINRLDWLHLDHKGHKRIQFDFDEKIKVKWLAS
ncbi:MAG: pyridoxamine 5'-phosphate oxidase family protein [Candidatus Marinimicrobia bacterium]|jgi:general stress protein 26|nr:pyridoxamine 5'-phosphate oxidase family protein [Candidatus Neomarinimicrobiota bacterium]|tara:strand:+ start:4564 stop:5148 length:585 start_codon:yes stop_codon:yes gene_type:complete